MNCDPREPTVLPNPLSKEVVVSCQSSYRRAARGLKMRAYLKVCPRLRFLKLSMMAADFDSMRTFAFLLVDFFRVMNEWLRRFAIREVSCRWNWT